MKDKKKDQWKTSNYDAYIHAEMDDAAQFLYAELRGLLFGGIVADARSGLDAIARSEGCCERKQTAWDVSRSLRAISRLVTALLNKTAWLDDESESCSIAERARDENKREFESAMVELAEICRGIAVEIGEALS